MTVENRFVAPADALPALAEAVRDAQGGDPLAAVMVVVPTNAVGVAARRWLGRHGGVAAVDMVTPGRLAERLVGTEFVASGRRPVSAPVVDLAVRAELDRYAGSFAAVAEHPATVTALRDAYVELRLAGDGALEALAAVSSRSREVARVAGAVATRLAPEWYDEADLLTAAAERLSAADANDAVATRIVVFEPALRHRCERRLVAALGHAGQVRILLPSVGVDAIDADVVERLVDAGLTPPTATSTDPPPGPAPTRRSTARLISTSDADDEVRHAVRALVDAARDGVPLAEMCLLWPTDTPYARLVEHHLDIAGLRWNGRPGTQVDERLVPRFLLDLLDLDRRGLRRADLFDLLADVPQRLRTLADQGAAPRSPTDPPAVSIDGDQAVPVARWERLAIAAGVVGDDDWIPRLRRHAHRLRRRAADHDLPAAAADADAADQLVAFVEALRHDLGRRWQRRTWAGWADWCTDQIEHRLGDSVLEHLDAAERLAADHAGRALDRLRGLDTLSEPVTRGEFRAVFAAEFEQAPGRLGRIGDGLTVGSLTADLGHDARFVVVLGAADGLMPAPPPVDPLLSEHDRASAGLASGRDRAIRAERRFAAVAQQSATLVVTVPRGDLRTSAVRPVSRWIGRHLPDVDTVVASSHHSALARTEFPAHRREHRLRRLLDATVGGHDRIADACAGDTIAAAGLGLRAGRRADTITEYDGDLTAISQHRLDAPVSPSQLEAWPACPHAYFIRYLLGVRAADDVVDEMSLTPLERGNVVHLTLDRFHQEVITGLLPQPGAGGWDHGHGVRLLELYDEVAEEFERSGRVGRPAPWSVHRRRLRNELLSWIRHDAAVVAGRQAAVVHSEVRFGDDDAPVSIPIGGGRQLAVRGVADRIDRGDDGTWYVTDHKTGRDDGFGTDPDDPTAGGTRYQLPIYGAAALALAGSTPTDHDVVHAEYSFLERGRFRRIGLDLDAKQRAVVATDLAATVTGIESGLYPAVTGPPKYRFRVECPYCEPDGLGVEERYGEWQRKQHDPRLGPWFEPDGDGPSR